MSDDSCWSVIERDIVCLGIGYVIFQEKILVALSSCNIATFGLLMEFVHDVLLFETDFRNGRS